MLKDSTLKKRQKAKELCRLYFLNPQGTPFELTDGQADIFCSIFFGNKQRVQIIASTQYGKSETIAMAVLLRSSMFHESWAIVTGQQSKSEIIMSKMIDHIFDNPYFQTELELDANEPLERIKRERSKKRVTWKGGGEVRTYTADARNKQSVNKSLTGFGAPNIVEDEASLVDDDLQSMVMRMLGGYKDSRLIKIGNPFTRGHFLRTWRSDKYYKIFIDYKQALAEGRYTEDFIDEMRGEPFFSILYECKFPEEDEIDARGYRALVTESTLIEHTKEGVELGPNLRLGVDISEGGDWNVYVLRGDSGARIEAKNRSSDLMTQVNEIQRIAKQYEIPFSSVFVDDTGVGAGVTARLKELGCMVNAVKVGTSARQDKKFTNKKAENFWELGVWLSRGGLLEASDGWNELLLIRYKEDSSSKLRIEPKEDLRKRGIKSPDIADALMLTFEPKIEPKVMFL